MRFTRYLVVVALVSTFTTLQAGDNKKDEEKLMGTWTLLSGKKGGEDAPPKILETFRLTFEKDGKIQVKVENEDKTGTIKVDASKKPKQIDFTVDNKTLEGIYVFEGENLKLCLGEANNRPNDFTSPAGTKTMLMVLKKEKK